MIDRRIEFKTGTSRDSKAWKTMAMNVSELCEKLKTTTYTPETERAYHAMSREDKANIKDIGGFVSGLFEGPRRLKAKMQRLEFLKYDIDSIPKGRLDGLSSCGYTGMWYTTHSSRPDDLRVRVLVFTDRYMTVGEGEYLERVFADRWLGGVDQVDKCSFEPHQLMYWPSTPSDGSYEFGLFGNELFPVDEWLADSIDWTDRSNWPAIPGDDEGDAEWRTLGDPREKANVVGAYCSERSITEAMDEDIPGVYTPCKGDTRFTYVNGSTAGGVLVYDDLWLWSMHTTDPCNTGHCCNAFDMVRIHKFGKLDKEKSYKDPTKSPSYQAMAEFALSIPAVTARLDSIRYRKAATAAEDFDEDLIEDGMGDEEAYTKVCSLLERRPKTGEILPSLENLTKILRNDPSLQNFRHNEMEDLIEVTGRVPWKRVQGSTWWSDCDLSGLKLYVSTMYTDFPKQAYDDVMNLMEAERNVHPLREKLLSFKWDGVPRVDDLLVRCLGAEDNEYTRAVTRKFLVGAVARVMKPGCKFDYALVFCGAQGVGKSTLIDRLSMGYSTDNLSIGDMAAGKEGVERIKGKWLVEIAEMAGMRKAETEAVKAFISRRSDRFRPAYARNVKVYERECVFVCTTNASEGYLRDETGNRRFWPLNVSASDRTSSPWDLSDWEVEQIWAEAKVIFDSGLEDLYLTGDVEKTALEVQRGAMESDPDEWRLRAYLDMELPEGWKDLSVEARATYFQSVLDHTEGTVSGDLCDGNGGFVKRDRVCASEIINECFYTPSASGYKPATMEPRKVARMMQCIPEWERVTNPTTFPIYGRQKYYRRKEG